MNRQSITGHTSTEKILNVVKSNYSLNLAFENIITQHNKGGKKMNQKELNKTIKNVTELINYEIDNSQEIDYNYLKGLLYGLKFEIERSEKNGEI